MLNLTFGHIITDFDWTKEKLLALFQEAEKIRKLYNANWDGRNFSNRQELKKCLFGKRIALLFWEPSSRTVSSFEAAAQDLGADVIKFTDMEKESSVNKGETLEDTIRTFAAWTDLIVLRHPEQGSAERAAEAATNAGYPTIIINAGDGKGFHPTQGLLDVYTLWRKFGEKLINGELIAGISGDLEGARVLHSLPIDLTLFGIPMVLVSPRDNNLPLEVENAIFFRKTGHIRTSDLLRWAPLPDFWYFCRLQVERHKSGMTEEGLQLLEQKYINQFGCTSKFRQASRKDAVFLHCGPQQGEFPEEAKKDPRSLIKEQVENGRWSRAALLKILLNPTFPLLI